MPSSPSEQIQAAQAAGLDILSGLANKGLDGLQKLVEVNLRPVKSTLADAQEATCKFLAAKDAADLFALQASLLQPAIEKAQAYQRELFEIAAAARGDFAKVADAQFEESKRKMQDVIDNAAKGAPAGSEPALAAWQSAMAAGATLCETMQQTAKQAMEAAENNLNVVSAAGAKAAQQATAQPARTAKH